MLATGSFIDGARYRIDALISTGPASDVYQAFDTVLNAPVAVKVFKHLRISGANKEPVAKFAREMKSLSRLSHNNIVTAFRCGYLSEGTPFLVEQLLTGQSLRARLNRESQLICSEAINIALEIAVALEYAHSCGIFHLDLKPENVMLEPQDGRTDVKIMDFGLSQVKANSADQESTLEPPGQDTTVDGAKFKGSLAYMSPEQCKSEATDERSDIYSFGCLLFHMITGFPPFESFIPGQVMMMHIHQRVPRILQLSGGCGLPRELDELIKRCTAKSKSARYQSFSELIPDLKSIAALNCAARYSPNLAKERANSRLKILFSLFLCMVAVALVMAHNQSSSSLHRTLEGMFVPLRSTMDKFLPPSSNSLESISKTTKSLLLDGKVDLAASTLMECIKSLGFKTAPPGARIEFLENQKCLFRSYGNTRVVSGLDAVILESLLEEAQENAQKKKSMDKVWQTRMKDVCRELSSNEISTGTWDHVRFLLDEPQNRCIPDLAGSAEFDLIELRGVSNLRMARVLSDDDFKHAAGTFMEAAAKAKAKHLESIYQREINLAQDTCKKGNINQVAQLMHLVMAEDAFDKNKIEEAKKELRLSQQLSIGLEVRKDEELRKVVLANKLKIRSVRR